MKLLFWLLVLVIATGLALFAVSNREAVSLAFFPLPFVLELPLYLAILAALLVGFLAGALAAWIGYSANRRDRRRNRRRIAMLERELAATQAALPGPSEPAAGQVTARPAAPIAVRG